MRNLSVASLSCGDRATSTFMTQQITALWVQEFFLNSCFSEVDLNSNLYATTRAVHRGRKGQMNCALGQELGGSFPKWQSSSGGESVYCSLLNTIGYSFIRLRFDYGGWDFFFLPSGIMG